MKEQYEIKLFLDQLDIKLQEQIDTALTDVINKVQASVERLSNLTISLQQPITTN